VLDDAEIVSDEEIAQTQIRLQILQHVDDLRLNGYVQRGHGFVTDDELGVGGQGAGDADALALTAGELVRVAGGLLAGDADDLEQLLHALVAFLLGLAQLVDINGLGHDIANRHAGIQRGVGILENHLRTAAELGHIGLVHQLAVKPDFAGSGLVEVEQAATDGGFAAAGFAYQTKGFALLNGEADIVNGLERRGLEETGSDGKILFEVFDLQKRLVLAHASSPPSRSMILMLPSSL